MNKHFSVMLSEAISSLKIKSNGIYVDLTFGRGGHSYEIFKHLKTGMLVAFDKDKDAIKESGENLEKGDKNFKLIHSDFKNFRYELEQLGIKKVDGILADLGVSSPQLNNADRGFSYNKNARLDMRMNQDQELSAYDIVNSYSRNQLVNIFRDFADVMLPQRVAKGIIANRPVNDTLELVNIIKNSLPAAIVRKKNPAKAVFQAIRIAVNNELESLDKMIIDAVPFLNKEGILSIITFHSLEDKIVKKHFGNLIKDETGKLPIIVKKQFKAKTYKPSKEELVKNKRSRSAKLRVLTKLKD